MKLIKKRLKKLRITVLFIFTFFCCLEQSNAEEQSAEISLDLYSKVATHQSQILIGTEVTSMTINAVQANGIGARIGFEFSINDRFAILPALSLVGSSSGTGAFLYTGLGAEFRYSVFGNYESTRSDVFNHEKLVKSELILPTPRLSASIGLSQLLLNGASQIYPASGVTLGAAYSFRAFSRWLEVSLKEGLFKAQDNSLSATILNLSFLIGI